MQRLTDSPSRRGRGRVPVQRHTTASQTVFDGAHIELQTLELCMVWALYRWGPLQALDWRVWLACRELVERRRHTGRRPRGRSTKPLTPSYTREEVRDLVGGGGGKVRDSIRRLEQAGLVRFRPDRIEFATSPDQLTPEKVPAGSLTPGRGDASAQAVFEMAARMPKRRARFPLPRRTLRMLCGSTKKTTAATVFGTLLTCCFYERGRGWDPDGVGGRVKASWIAEAFGVCKRSVERAREHLVELGWMEQPEPENGWEWVKRNKGGARCVVNRQFARTVRERELSTPEMSPRLRSNAPEMSPPDSEQTLSSRTKHQKPERSAPGPQADVSRTKGGRLPEPNWKQLVTADLESIPRLVSLFDQVVRHGILDGGGVERLNFCAAAQRARAKGTSNPCGLFRAMVERKRWADISNDDEEAVRAPLARFLNGEPEQVVRSSAIPQRRARLSEDARFAQRVLCACQNRGIRQRDVIFRELNRRHPEWSEARWGRALAEFDSSNHNDCGLALETAGWA